ncbi:MAG: hypothetical protein ACRDV2_16975, partial [Actinomycetes bacterium]
MYVMLLSLSVTLGGPFTVDLPQRLDVVVLRLHAGERPGRLDDDVRQLGDAELACRLVLGAD